MVACLNLLYKIHNQGEQQHNDNIKQISIAIKNLQESVTDAMSKLEAFNKQYNTIMKALKTIH